MWSIFVALGVSIVPIKVLIIDTGVSPLDVRAMGYVHTYDIDRHNHGTAITHIVLSDQDNDWVCRRVEVDVCDYKFESPDMDAYYNCLSKALTNDYDYVNLSISGPSVSDIEEDMLERITHKSVVVVAAGNNGRDIKGFYPASYLYKGWSNFKVITNLASDKSNYGPNTIDMNGQNILTKGKDNNYIMMSGTSMSAARYTHKLLKDRCVNESR